MKSYTVNNQCRICRGQNLTKFLDLEDQPLANAFLKKEDLGADEPKYPLRVFFCQDCGLSQLTDIVDPNILFRDYVYFSSGMPRLSEHFRTYARQVREDFMSKGDLVVELGSNDGILLHEMKDFGVGVLGVDPALNIAKVANERGVETIPDFFSEELAKKIVSTHGRAHAIIGNNVVAHINDYHDLMRGVGTLLAPKGVFVFEAPYLADMFENLTFDTVYHEHMSYLSVRPLMNLFAQYGMEIIDAKLFPVQGMSLRVYAAKKGAYEVRPSVAELINRENQMGMSSIDAYQKLAVRVAGLKTEVISVLHNLKRQGKRVAGYGAPAKGNTLLNYFGIGPDILENVNDALPSKIGLFTPGMHIPVIDIKEARKNSPDYYFMLAWNYQKAVVQQEAEFLQQGGKFIMPVGNTRIISIDLLRN